MAGKGISDAVRNTIPAWMDAETRTAIRAAASQDGINLTDSVLREPRNWVRNKRFAIGNGFMRPYRNNAVPSLLGLTLEVRTNITDTTINYFTVKMKGKTITGGDCRVSSVLVTARKPDQARIGSKTTSAEEEVSTSPFKRLTQAQVDRINVEMDFGDGNFDKLFEERS